MYKSLYLLLKLDEIVIKFKYHELWPQRSSITRIESLKIWLGSTFSGNIHHVVSCENTIDPKDIGHTPFGIVFCEQKSNLRPNFRSSPGADGEGAAAANKDSAPLDPALPRGPPETDQNIVPQLLIDHYVSMIDPSRVQTVEADIARHCAFSFPAVALTLGRSNWPLLKVRFTLFLIVLFLYKIFHF